MAERLEGLPREELHAVLLRDVSDAVIATDRNLRVVSWNDAARRMYGWTEEEMSGRILDEILETKFMTETQIEAQRVLFRDRYWQGEVEQTTREGDRITVEARVSLLLGPRGEPIGGVTVNRDVTERNRAMETLRDERDRNRQITDISPVGIVRVRLDGHVLYANGRARSILGIPPEERGIPQFNDAVWDITRFDGSPFPEDDLPLRVVQRTGTPVYDVRHTIRRRDGTRRFLSVHGVPLCSHSGDVIEMVGVIDDITDEYQFRQLLHVQRDMLVRIGSADTAVGVAEAALEATMMLNGIDCGAIYLRSERGRGEELEMVTLAGLKPEELAGLSPVALNRPVFHHMVVDPAPYYGTFAAILERVGIGDRVTEALGTLRGAAIVPITTAGELIATMHVASFVENEIPALTKEFLEQLTSWLGDIIVKKFYQQELAMVEHTLRTQAQALTDANTALKVILRTQQEEQGARFEALRNEFERHIRPVVRQLRQAIAGGDDGGLLDVLEIKMDSLLRSSPADAAPRSVLSHLTPREAQVAALIRSDHSSKEIAEKLSISRDAVAFHRKQIRSKLGLTGSGKNLRQFLASS